ncbi:MAG: site-2 protease family protein [Anaerolineaceae bacterium]|jgi:Zn-dependent protease|nr:site-2 protease family protein [Anaerolineaceae bacterium]
MLGLSAPTLISRLITLVIALSFHEFAHAWTANFFGDDTPRMNGRLTLNPLAHLDPIGSLMLVLVGFGWAKPVPVNMYALQRRSQSAPMWVSVAGPLSNLLLAILAAIPLRLRLVPFAYSNGFFPSAFGFLSTFIQINLLLMIFNLIPLAPLDGEKVAQSIFPPSWVDFLDTIRPYGPLILMALLFVLPRLGIDIIGWIIRPLFNLFWTLLVG